jgi:hypothetical protein
MSARAFPGKSNAKGGARSSAKTREAWGLISAGGASRSYLARMPSIKARLGPVKASSFQVARRLANALRAGFAVSHYSALEYCPVIWIYEPEHAIDRVLRDLSAQMPVRGTMIVLCECVRDSFWPSSLRAAGARIATLNLVEPSQEKIFVAEGHEDTLRVLDQILGEEKRKLIQMPPASKPLYFAGIHLAKYLPLPAIAASVESLRAAGFPRAQAARLMETLVMRAVASYERAGRKAWRPGAGAELRESLEANAELLEQSDPRLAAIYAEGIRTALGYFADAKLPLLARRYAR